MCSRDSPGTRTWQPRNTNTVNKQSGVYQLNHELTLFSANMSDNEYGDDDGGEEYDVFAAEDDEPQMDEPTPLEADPGADMEIVDAGDAGGAGLRSADDRITTKYMTKYERARILGTRALQIRCGVSRRAGRY